MSTWLGGRDHKVEEDEVIFQIPCDMEGCNKTFPITETKLMKMREHHASMGPSMGVDHLKFYCSPEHDAAARRKKAEEEGHIPPDDED